MNYSEQLQQEEWKQKRYEILERDHFECQVCHVKRSDFLGLSFEFGIVNYTDFLILGYIVKRTGKNSESIEITKNGNKINCIITLRIKTKKIKIINLRLSIFRTNRTQ